MVNDEKPPESGSSRTGSKRRTVLRTVAASGLAGTGLASVTTARHGTAGENLLTVESEFGTGQPQKGFYSGFLMISHPSLSFQRAVMQLNLN